MKLRLPATWLSGLLLAVLACTAGAQTAAQPRVGLVLAGGGARGLAHIGVIKYLEEQGIRVDAIAGTSMGAVVGGMYASGLDAAAMEEIATTLDWKYALDDTTPRNQLSFRRKQQDLDFLVRAKMRFKEGKLRLPMGAIEGQHLNLLLHDIVGHVSRVREFDALPIPFRAVATDLETGDPVILRDGDLAVAMRASMSIPGIFSPVDFDGKLLIDGGIANNVPVDVVQAMGVDRLIVIDVGTPLYDRKKLENVLSLMDQLTTIMTRKNSEQQLARMGPDDILVSPGLDEAGVLTMGFDKAELAIRLGYEAAAAMGPQLAALAAPQAPHLAERPRLRLPRIDEIRIESDAPVSKALLRNMIKQPLGKKLDHEQMERDIAEIYGLDEFSRVDYDVAREDERYVLTLRATAHPAGVSYLKLGMSWDQDSRGSSEFGLRASWLQKGINPLGAEWYTVGQLGGRSRFGTEFHQPLDVRRRFFVDARYDYQQRLINVSDSGDVRARALVDDHRLELAPGMHFANLASVRAGAYLGTANTDIQIGSPLLSSSSEDDGGYFAELRYDSLDRAFFPRMGMRLNSRYDEGLDSRGAETDYQAWSSSALVARSWGRHTLNATARWSQLDLDTDRAILTLPSQVFTLGGFLSLSGYTRDALAGNYLGLANLVYYRRFNEQSILPTDLPVYLGASLEAGNTWFFKEDAALDDLVFAGSLFLGVDSPLGPVYLGVGLGEDGQRALYLQVGQVFD